MGIRLPRPLHLPAPGEVSRPTTIWWRRREGEPFSVERRGVHWWEPRDTAATFWIYAPVQAFEMRVKGRAAAADPPRVMLLVPDSSSGR